MCDERFKPEFPIWPVSSHNLTLLPPSAQEICALSRPSEITGFRPLTLINANRTSSTFQAPGTKLIKDSDAKF
jgi:hypothetical protein